MRFLIDTQILVWLIIESKKIPTKILNILENPENEILVSSVSIWEIAIKISINKLSLPFELKYIINVIEKMNIKILEINIEHLINVAELPFHHKDPFDRLLISQSMIENISIISSDSSFQNYKVDVIW